MVALIEVIRNTPFLFQIFFIYFSLLAFGDQRQTQQLKHRDLDRRIKNGQYRARQKRRGIGEVRRMSHRHREDG